MAKMKLGASATILVLCATLGSVLADGMPLTLFSDASARQAVCNDGTPAGYYYRPGVSERWIIFFQGSPFCSNRPMVLA